MSTHGHRHFNAEFTKYRMLGQKYFYNGTGNNVSIEFDVHIDWLMIFSNNGTKYGMYIKRLNQCYLSGNFNSNPCLDNSITSSNSKVFLFTAGNWSVIGNSYCIIAFGQSPREVPKQGYAFHKHTKGYDDRLKTQCNTDTWNGMNGNTYHTIGFNYAVCICIDATTGVDAWFGLNPFAYLSYGSRNFHREGYNVVNPQYNLNVLNTSDDPAYGETRKKQYLPANELDVLPNLYDGFFIGAYDKSAYVFEGGAYPGHKHETGWDDYNRVVGYVGNYVGTGAINQIVYPFPMIPDVLIMLKQTAGNDQIMFIKVLDYDAHAVSISTRLTKAGTSVSLQNLTLSLYGKDYMKSFKTQGLTNVNGVSYIFVALQIVNPKTV